MKEQEIKQLLERYWVCETSLEEERQLLVFFSGNNLPEELKIYRPLFVRTVEQSAIKADKKPVNRINRPLRLQLYPVLRAAASILLLLTVGIGFFTHYRQEKVMDRIFSDTCSDPEDAAKETERAVAKVSSVLQLMEEKKIWEEVLDSIRAKGNSLQEVKNE